MLDNSRNVKYSIILWTVLDLKVGNNNSICVIKYSMLHTSVTSCLRKLVRFCQAVISLTAFSHGYLNIKQLWRKIVYAKYQTMLHLFRSCSYLFTLLLSFQFYWHIRLKSAAYFFDPPCIRKESVSNKCIAVRKVATPLVCRYNWHSFGSLRWSFTMLKY